MATSELIRDGLRAYELGRLRVAARIAWLVLPAVAFCALSTGATDVSCCLGALVLAGAVYLRWRDRTGVRATFFAIGAGLVALLVGLLLVGHTPWWLALNVAAGLCAGAAGRRAGLLGRDAVSSVALASLTAALGCAGAGPAVIATAMTTLAIGAFVGRRVAGTRSP